MVIKRALQRKSRKLRHRFGAAAPRVVVKPETAWGKYAALILAIVFLLGLAVGAGVRLLRSGHDADEVDTLRTRLLETENELLKLRATVGTEQSVVQIGRSEQQQLVAKMQALEAENVALKEERIFLERLIAAPADPAGVRLESLRAVPEAPGKLRYRLFAAYQPTKAAPEFKGRLEFRLVYLQDGREVSVKIPENRGDAGYQLQFNRFVRKEGVLELPTGGKPISLEARILQGDTPKGQREIKL